MFELLLINFGRPVDIEECDEEMVDQTTVAGQEGISLENQIAVQEMKDSSVWQPGLDAGSYVSRQTGAIFSLISHIWFMESSINFKAFKFSLVTRCRVTQGYVSACL